MEKERGKSDGLAGKSKGDGDNPPPQAHQLTKVKAAPESTLKVKMTKTQAGGTVGGPAKNTSTKSSKEKAGPSSMAQPAGRSTSSTQPDGASRKQKLKIMDQKVSKAGESGSSAQLTKESAGEKAPVTSGGPGPSPKQQPNHQRKTSSNKSHQTSKTQQSAAAQQPPQSQSQQVSGTSQQAALKPSTSKTEKVATSTTTTTKKTVITTRKIKVASSTKKKLGQTAPVTTGEAPSSSSAAAAAPTKTTSTKRTTIIKKVIRKKKGSKSVSGSGQVSSSNQTPVPKTVSKQESKSIKGGSASKPSSSLKLKSQKSQESASKPQRPSILLAEDEEQFRWILKPFATVEDQKTWRERFTNLLSQREMARSDPEKKEPPCMACYTRVPPLANEVMSLFEVGSPSEEDGQGQRGLSPTDATWLTMRVFCKRCCHNKSQLTGGHLGCVGLKNRGYQLLDLTPPGQPTQPGAQKRILLFECDLCSYVRSMKTVEGGEAAVKKFATCLICGRRNSSSSEHPGSLMKKVLRQNPCGATDEAASPFVPCSQGVHAICAAIKGRQSGLKLIDARQMLYAAVNPLELEEQKQGGATEERKESYPKCDICKVSIKRPDSLIVKCHGVDYESKDAPIADSQNEDHAMEEEDQKAKEELKATKCNKRVHPSCLMERSKWKAFVKDSCINGYCRSHESQFKEEMPERHLVLRRLLRIQGDVMLLLPELNGVEMELSVNASRFKQNLPSLLGKMISLADNRGPEEAVHCDSNNSLIKLPQLKRSLKDGEDDSSAATGPMSVFDQNLAAKLWFSQASQALARPVSETLLAEHIDHASSTLLFDFADVIQQLRDKQEAHIPEPTDAVRQLLEQGRPLDIYTVGEDGVEVIDANKKATNEQAMGQTVALLTELLQRASLLKDYLLELYMRRNEHFALSQGQAMLEAPEKSLLFEDVQGILSYMQQLDLTNYTVYAKLSALYSQQTEWRNKIKHLLESKTPELSALTNEFRQYRNFERGISLVQSRIAELKRLFNEKAPCEELIALFDEDLNQTVFDNYRYIQRLQQKYLWVTEFDDLPQALEQFQHQARPVKHLYQTLLRLACQPLRAHSSEALLSTWQHASIWQLHAKSFVALYTSVAAASSSHIATGGIDMDMESSNEPDNVDEAIEADMRLLKGLKDLQADQSIPRVTSQLARYLEQTAKQEQLDEEMSDEEESTGRKRGRVAEKQKRMMFTDEDINELLESPCANGQLNFVYDKALIDRVWHRANYLRELKQRLAHVAQECHQLDEIKSYIKACKAQSNFDLSHEAEVAKEKLCLMEDALKIGAINNQEDQGLVASEVYSRVQKLKERQEDTIRIPGDLEFLLQAKVQISEKLRRDFYDILQKGKGADSFNKEQMNNLREIVNKATKDHGLQMETERKIVENIKTSEAWLEQTFRSVRNMCGPALNDIDFKDFQQLHSIFRSARDCELLIKQNVHSKSQVDNLVGAAKNLYMSLLRAKWLFDVKNLMDKATGTKDLAQLLCLYKRANELEIDFTKTQGAFQDTPESARLPGQEGNSEEVILKEFNRLGQVANEFDQLFGTHQKIIQSLERHEKLDSMEELKAIVSRLQKDLLYSQQQAEGATGVANETPSLVKIESQYGSQVFAISTANEVEILHKVSDYIRLNENYNEYMLRRTESAQDDDQVEEEDRDLKNETEVQKPAEVVPEESKVVVLADQDQQAPPKFKISYQKAMELQRQAREQLIPDDIPVLKRLNVSVQRFEKFRRLCTDYHRFREKIKAKGSDLLTSSSALIGQKTQERSKLLIAQGSSTNNQAHQTTNADTKFSLSFLKRLLQESEEIDIEVPKEHFNKEKILEELAQFQQWKVKTELTLKQLEKELSHQIVKADINNVISEQTRSAFEHAKQKIKDLPVFDNETFMRIQAFEWLLMATSLIQGQQHQGAADSQTQVQGGAAAAGSAAMQSQRIYSLTFWEQLFRQHENYLKVLPMLEDHPIIQNILWEMDRAKHIVEFVKHTKKTIQSNQGKFLSDRYQNYVAFKEKHDPAKIRKYLEQALNTRVDIHEETQALKEWIKTYERYTTMAKIGTLYTGNTHDKVKQIYKNIFLSPLDFGDMYFEIGKRLEIASQIKQDIKFITEENQLENNKRLGGVKKRLSLSRLETDLNHHRKNCQIPGIYEIERVISQIKTSRKTIQDCLAILTDEESFPADDIAKQTASLKKAKAIQEQIEIDMEDEETEIKKLITKKTLDLLVDEKMTIDANQAKASENDYKLVLKKQDGDDEKYSDFFYNVNMCLKMIRKCPTKELLDEMVREKVKEVCPQVNFEQLFIDHTAQLFHQGSGKSAIAAMSDSSGSDAEEGEQEMSEEEESSDNGSQVSAGGKDSAHRSVSSSSDDDSDSSSSGDDSSSSSDDSDAEDSSSEESKVAKPKTSSATKKVTSATKGKVSSSSPKNGEQEDEAESGEIESESDEEDNSEDAIAHRKSKRTVKANKMDDHIYYQSGKKRNAKEAGISSGSGTGSVTKKKRHASSESDGSDDDEDEERAVFSDDDEEGGDGDQNSQSLSKEQKKRREEARQKRRQLKRERKEARQAERIFKKEKARQMEIREKRKLEEMSPIETDMAVSISQDQELQSRLKQTQDRIRNKSKTQIYDALAKFDKRFFALSKTASAGDDDDEQDKEMQYSIHLKTVMQQLESKVYERNTQVNAQYQSKVSDIVQNLYLLQSSKYKDLAELFFVRKSIQLTRLMATCPAFAEFIEKVHSQRMERRQRQMLQRSQAENNRRDDSGLPFNTAQHHNANDDVTIPKHQQLLKLQYPPNPEKPAANKDLSKHAFTKQEISVESPEKAMIHHHQQQHNNGAATTPEEHKGGVTLTRHDSLASIDSLESNPAKFSDDEDFNPLKLASSGLVKKSKRRERPHSSQAGGPHHNSHQPTGNKSLPVPCIIQLQQFKYNPYSIVQATKQSKLGGAGGPMFDINGMAIPGLSSLPPSLNASKPEQILYNPMKNATATGGPNAQPIKIRNSAAPGSLLKVWEGKLDVGTSGARVPPPATQQEQLDNNIECQMFSVGDIRQYQCLPEFPMKLTLKGKSKVQEVTSHFRKLRQEMHGQKPSSSNVLLKGWVTRKNVTSQENSDRYTSHFEMLEQAGRCSVFTLFEGVSVYLIPITDQTKDFCRMMGIYPVKGRDNNNNPEECSLLEETHYYAFVSQIRQSFSKRSSYQNPEVICHAHEMPKRHLMMQQQARSQADSQAPTPALKSEMLPYSTAQREESKTAPGPLKSDPRFGPLQQPFANAASGEPTVINLIQAATPQVKSEVYVPPPPTHQGGDVHMVNLVDEDEARIDALIEKFRAQEDPNIDEIQRELPPLLNSKESGRKEEKLVNFLKEVIAKVQSKQIAAAQKLDEPIAALATPPQQQSHPSYPPPLRPPPHESDYMRSGFDHPMHQQMYPPPPGMQADMAGMPPPYGDASMMHHHHHQQQQQRFDPTYGGGLPQFNQQHHPHMMGSRPSSGQQQQSHMQQQQQQMDHGHHSQIPYMRLPPTSFPQHSHPSEQMAYGAGAGGGPQGLHHHGGGPMQMGNNGGGASAYLGGVNYPPTNQQQQQRQPNNNGKNEHNM